ncbi:UBC-like protein [Serendipita vermifera]|nr:UBC-like protein [Serendipita vermifera]
MASKTASKRLAKEYMLMQQDPPPFVWAVPDEKNILNWHYLVRGPPDSPYNGGEYHGMIMFPPEYPFKPPGIKMFTPSGRFVPDKKICFSMSDFHPGTWNPAWSVATILTGLLSFMLSDEITTGSASSTVHEKMMFANRSHSWNIQQKRFRDAFPDYCTPELRDMPNMGVKERGQPDPAPASSDQDGMSASLLLQGAGTRPSQSRSGATATGTDGKRVARPPAAAGDKAALGWPSMLRRVVWEKWRWGVFMVIAVVVARFSS